LEKGAWQRRKAQDKVGTRGRLCFGKLTGVPFGFGDPIS